MSFIAAGIGAASAIGGAALSANSARNAAQAAKPPKYLREANKDLTKRGTAIADRPYEAYTGQRVASLTGLEQQAGGLAGSMSGRYQPMIDRGAREFSATDLARFENPYMERVVQGRLDDVGRTYDRQLGGLNRKRGMMDAFGTDRGSMMETALLRDRARETDRVSNEGRASAYQSALDAYFQDKQSALEGARVGAAADAQSISSMLESGARERSVAQGQADFDYGQFLERRDWSVTNLQPLMDAIRTASGGQSSGTTPSGPDYGTMLAGLGTTVAGALTQYQAGKDHMSGLSPVSITATRIPSGPPPGG
jgi:hypothetical protein